MANKLVRCEVKRGGAWYPCFSTTRPNGSGKVAIFRDAEGSRFWDVVAPDRVVALELIEEKTPATKKTASVAVRQIMRAAAKKPTMPPRTPRGKVAERSRKPMSAFQAAGLPVTIIG